MFVRISISHCFGGNPQIRVIVDMEDDNAAAWELCVPTALLTVLNDIVFVFIPVIKRIR